MGEALAVLNQFQGAFQLGVLVCVLYLSIEIRYLRKDLTDLEDFVYPSRRKDNC